MKKGLWKRRSDPLSGRQSISEMGSIRVESIQANIRRLAD
jgi:hypothetical protein